MEVHQLRYFVAVAETGSISRAARRCDVAQPSMSQQIRRLEDGLSVRLFDRIGRGVVMTEAGRSLLPRARRILREVADAQAHVGDGSGTEAMRLMLGAIPTMAPFVLPPLIASLKEHSPDCDFIIREDLTENLVEALVNNEIDVAIVSTPIEHDLVELDVIAREPMLVVVPSDHPFQRLDAVRGTDLREEPAVTLHEMHCLGRQINEFCTAQRINRSVVCRTTQLMTVLELVRRKLGISVIPAMAAAHDSGEGLAFLPIRTNSPYREIAVAWRIGRTRPRIAGRLRSLLAEQFETSR